MYVKTHISTFFIFCIYGYQCSCFALPPVPEAIKNFLSVTTTTVTKSPDQAPQDRPSFTYVTATFGAATLTTMATNSIFQSTPTYRALNKVTVHILKRYTNLPPLVRRNMLPALSLAASTAFSTVCFMALFPPAKIIEDTVEESFNELESEIKKKK